MRVLVWQWGKRGAGPRIAAELARGFDGVPGVQALLSLSAQAELLRSADAPDCALPVPTYAGLPGFLGRALAAPFQVRRLAAWLRAQRIGAAVCAMPAPMDFVMAAALRRAGVPYAVVVHDAELHPGDTFPLQVPLQRRLMAGAASLFALSAHVADRLRALDLVRGRPLLVTTLPPLSFGPMPLPPRAHGGPLRLLSFGRLLPYKGLDLLAEALALLGPQPDLVVRVVGHGPETPVLDRLRAAPGVTVENRWVPEDEVGGLLAWSDALVLSHTEASQSGVAAAAVAAGRWLVATRVGGLAEQAAAWPGAVLCAPDATGVADGIGRVLAGAVGPVAADAGRGWLDTADRMARQLTAARCGVREAG